MCFELVHPGWASHIQLSWNHLSSNSDDQCSYIGQSRKSQWRLIDTNIEYGYIQLC